MADDDPQPDRSPEHRTAEARACAEALCRCVWAGHDDEAQWWARELDRLEHEQP